MKLVEHFFRTLAPANCLKCGQEGSLLCAWCVPDALPETEDRCYRCNKLSRFSATCTACRRKTPIAHLWKCTEYSDIARVLVHTMKFKYSGEAADFIAKQLVGTIPALPPETVLVYVPTATNHVRQRGFDHARRIARELSRHTGLPYLPILARTNQFRQVGASRSDRFKHLEKAFRVKHGQSIVGTRVLLIDDVLTTGATMEAAAKTLKQAGAAHIDAVVFAAGAK